jgi:predicted PurR-regulated permease PerM
MSDWTFFRRVLIAGAAVAFAFLLWRLADALLLLFGAVLIGLLLSGACDAIHRATSMPRALALALVVLLIIGIFAGVGSLFGTQISLQLVDLWQRLPGAIDSFEARLGLGDVSGRLMQQLQANTGNILFEITSWAGLVLNGAANAVLLLAGAIYLAAEPQLYRDGALKLVPPAQRPQIAETLDFSAAALRQWLLGQLIAVLLIGATVAIGTYFIGLPAPLALGMVAGLGEFIPYAGPIVAAVPSILLAFTQSWTHVALTLGLILVVQQLESYVITPLIQRRMVSLPPVISLFAIVCFGLLFGPLGVLFATPLAVFILVVVNNLYVRGLLEEPAEVPGEKQALQEKREKAGA